MAYRSRPHYQPSNTTGYSTQSTAKQCSFEWDMARGAYAVKPSKFQVNFVEFIKAKIPGSDRAWDPASQTWYIKEAWFDIMFELASELWPNGVSCITKEQSEKAWKEQEESRRAMLAAQRQAVLGPLEAALLDFCSLCDLDALKACYRKAAQTLHPDKQGGDGDKMARLNAAWFTVEKEITSKTKE